LAHALANGEQQAGGGEEGNRSPENLQPVGAKIGDQQAKGE
jgi:hypothetical protein